MPKISPHKRRKTQHQIQANHNGIERPTLLMHRTRAFFQQKMLTPQSTQIPKPIHSMMQNIFIFQWNHTQSTLCQKWRIRHNQRQNQ